MSTLKIRDESGVFHEIPVIQGPKGDKGDDGVATQQTYVGDEQPSDENIEIWIDTNDKTSSLPTNTSQLVNDSGFITLNDSNTKSMMVTNYELNEWTEDDTTFEGYPFKYTITANGIDDTWACIMFVPDHTRKDLDGVFYDTVITGNNTISVFTSQRVSATIETILLQKVVSIDAV